MRRKTRTKAVAKDKNRLVVDTITQVAGEQAIPVIRYLKDKKNISEFNKIRSFCNKKHALQAA